MIKEQVYRKCLDILNARIDKYKGELEIIKESIENNDKASSDEEGGGNTDFTSAQNKVVQYLEEANQMKDQLKQVDIFQTNEVVKIGSIIETSMGNFFLSIPLGKIELDGKMFFAISKEAPVGQLLLDKQVGDTVTFNNNNFTIKVIH